MLPPECLGWPLNHSPAPAGALGAVLARPLNSQVWSLRGALAPGTMLRAGSCPWVGAWPGPCRGQNVHFPRHGSFFSLCLSQLLEVGQKHRNWIRKKTHGIGRQCFPQTCTAWHHVGAALFPRRGLRAVARVVASRRWHLLALGRVVLTEGGGPLVGSLLGAQGR